jgi:protein-disulfide isomerase
MEDHDIVYLVPLGDAPRRGGREPLVTIVEFGDFECPFTRAAEDVNKRILETYGDDVALVWKDLCMDLHPLAEPAARLARLARAEQGDEAFWGASTLLFAACADNDRDALPGVGAKLGLPSARVREAIAGPTPPEMEDDIALGTRLGDTGTPTYFINGRRVSDGHPLEELRPLIDDEMAKAKTLVASGVPRARVYDELQKGARPAEPLEAHPVAIHEEGAVLSGAEAALDVHQFADETNFFVTLSEPVVDYVLREYGERIRYHWHWMPAASNELAMRVAFVSEGVYGQNGGDVFWKFHRALLDDAPFPFAFKDGRPHKGFGDDALREAARTAGANLLYFEGLLHATPDGGRWESVRRGFEGAADGHGSLYADGYWFGSTRRAKLVLDKLLAGH